MKIMNTFFSMIFFVMTVIMILGLLSDRLLGFIGVIIVYLIFLLFNESDAFEKE